MVWIKFVDLKGNIHRSLPDYYKVAFSVNAYVMVCKTIFLPTQADAMILHVF